MAVEDLASTLCKAFLNTCPPSYAAIMLRVTTFPERPIGEACHRQGRLISWGGAAPPVWSLEQLIVKLEAGDEEVVAATAARMPPPALESFQEVPLGSVSATTD